MNIYRLHLKSNHEIGLCHAAQNFQKAKENVARLLNCTPDELFCSLITELDDVRFYPTYYYPKNRRG